MDDIAPDGKPSLLAILLRRLGSSWLLPIFIAPFVIFIYLRAVFTDVENELIPWGGTPLTYIGWLWLAIFSSAFFFGALGATISFFSRADTDRVTKRSIVAAQLFGAIFALVLTLMFVGGLIKGSLFPLFSAYLGDFAWSTVHFNVESWAKLMVWSFIAGFSERFVPDLLNRLIHQSEQPEKPKEPPSES